MVVIYRNVENGNEYRIRGGRVFRRQGEVYFRSMYLKPCDLAHYPFIGIREKSTKS